MQTEHRFMSMFILKRSVCVRVCTHAHILMGVCTFKLIGGITKLKKENVYL